MRVSLRQVFILFSFSCILSTSYTKPALASNVGSSWRTLDGSPPQLYGHRGEKVLMPEHTVPGYELASILGADYVEPDLCMTKDDVFVCHHDIDLRDGTDVKDRPEFDHLKRKTEDGYNWFIRDFTIAQLKTLRIIQQNIGIRPQDFNSYFTIPTFAEYLGTIHRMTFKLNRTVGIVPELKVPSFHNENRSKNFMETQLLITLASQGYPVNGVDEGNCKANVSGTLHDIKCPPVIVQCFETPALEYLKSQTDLELLHLVDDPKLLTYKGMERVAQIAKYYSTWKEYLYVGVAAEMTYRNKTWNETEVEQLGGFIPPIEFTVQAHKLGLKINLYTFPDSREPSTRGCAIVPGCEPANKTKELSYYFDLGVDSIFIENVAESKAILSQYEDEFKYRNYKLKTAQGDTDNKGKIYPVISTTFAGLVSRTSKGYYVYGGTYGGV